jgi:hypothetical protein
MYDDEDMFRVLDFWFLAPSLNMRNSMLNQVMWSEGRAVRVMYVGRMVLQALNQPPRIQDSTLKRCIDWIKESEQRLVADVHRRPLLCSIGDSLAAHVEVGCFSGRAFSGANNNSSASTSKIRPSG